MIQTQPPHLQPHLGRCGRKELNMDEKYQAIDFEMATAIYSCDKTYGLQKFQKQLDRAIDKEKLILQRKKKQALEFIPYAKEGHPAAIEWLKKEFSLHVYTHAEIEEIRPYLTPPEPEPRPFMLNFRMKNSE